MFVIDDAPEVANIEIKRLPRGIFCAKWTTYERGDFIQDKGTWLAKPVEHEFFYPSRQHVIGALNKAATPDFIKEYIFSLIEQSKL